TLLRPGRSSSSRNTLQVYALFSPDGSTNGCSRVCNHSQHAKLPMILQSGCCCSLANGALPSTQDKPPARAPAPAAPAARRSLTAPEPGQLPPWLLLCRLPSKSRPASDLRLAPRLSRSPCCVRSTR